VRSVVELRRLRRLAPLRVNSIQAHWTGIDAPLEVATPGVASCVPIPGRTWRDERRSRWW